MAIPTTYSERSRESAATGQDVYTYNSLPDRTLRQIRVIFDRMYYRWVQEARRESGLSVDPDYQKLEPLAMEIRLGVDDPGIDKLKGSAYFPEIIQRFLEPPQSGSTGPSVLAYLDLFEVLLQHLGDDTDESDLNQIFRRSGIGYRLHARVFTRVDSELMHRDVVVPALTLLADPRFAGANAEYLLAHRAYMDGRNSECLVNCGKAFESAMKVTLTLARHAFDSQRDTAVKLVDHLKSAGVLQPEVLAQFPPLIACLKEGVPPVRNRLAGHGAGATPHEVPDHVASYLLHLTGANILLVAGGVSTPR